MTTPDFEVYLEQIDYGHKKPEKITLLERTLGEGTFVSRHPQLSGLLVGIKDLQGDPINQATLVVLGEQKIIKLDQGIGRTEFPPDYWLVVQDNNKECHP